MSASLDRDTGSVDGHRWRAPAVYAAIFAVAFAVRFLVAQASGGLTRIYLSYDAGVYYAAADALSFGRLPYRDFVLLHPPALTILLTPFAVLGRLTDDHVGFMVAVIASMALGAVNAVLATVVCSRMGMSRAAALLGGAFYALWLGSAQAEYQIRLEPLGNAFILLGLLAYLSSRKPGSRSAALWAGVAFGLAVTVKIWWAAAVVVLIGWHLARTRRRALLPLTAGAASAIAVVTLPFAIAAPSAMWQMVVADQLARPDAGVSPAGKARTLLGTAQLLPGAPLALVAVAIVLAAAMAVTTIISAWRLPAARLVVTLLAVQLVVLLATPSWFVYYADYLAPAAAVTVAAGFAGARSRRGTVAPFVLRGVPVLAVLVVGAVTARFLATGTGAPARPPPAELTAAVSSVRCLMSDSPSGLILLDALSRSLANGCPNWVDVTGRTYGIDKAVGPDGKPVPRADNSRWQRDLLAYLTSGDAVFLVRVRGTGEDAATLRALRSGPVLARSGSDVVYLTPYETSGPPR